MFGQIGRRFVHLSSAAYSVRVRFAPSPTGYIHLGGLRTALYNYLFAKSRNGKFILRIEDTDQKRLVPGAAEQLERDLEWMGFIPDESPMRKGSYGPYTQSHRLRLYRDYVEQLVKNEHAYHCFCSDHRLEIMKKEALREGSIPRYDNRCRSLSQKVVEEKKRQGIPYCIRFKLKPLTKHLVDLVFGKVDCTPVEHEGDPVILKQDGYPTYHLANVVDDHLMEITHVLRGTEWLVSTPKHVLLYEAFNWKPPEFAHLPLILNADGTKLSKRQDDIRLDYFRNQGFLPEAIIGLLCLAGGGFPNNEVQQNLLPVSQLAQLFRLEDMTTHSSRLDMLRLEQFNQQALQDRVQDPTQISNLIHQLRHLVQQTLDRREVAVDQSMLDEANLKKILTWAVGQGRIHLLKQLVSPDMEFLWSQPRDGLESNLTRSQISHLLNQIVAMLDQSDSLNRTQASDRLRRIAVHNQLKLADLMKLTRSALTGLKQGPSVGEIIEILGPQICIRRLTATLNALGNVNDLRDRN